MAHTALSDTGDWKLRFPDKQDIRGSEVLDTAGVRLGTIDEMIVDTEAERVTEVILENGKRIPAADLTIVGDTVYVGTPAAGESVTVFDEDGHVVRRETVANANFDEYNDAFRQHHDSTYGTSGRYEDRMGAYRHGFDSAHDDANRNRTFMDAESDVKTSYASSQTGRDYDSDREAVRYGYLQAQRSGRTRT